MPNRLPDSLNLLYAELLQQASLHPALPHRGLSFSRKEVKGRKYWYLQLVIGAQRTQLYLGEDTSEMRERVDAERALWKARESDDAKRKRLAAMLRRGGAAIPTAAEGRVLEVLERAGAFLVGGTLIGSHAFAVYGNLLGVRWEGELSRTRDIDLAGDPRLKVAVPLRDVDVKTALVDAGLGFFAVPALDPKHPSTSFAIRGQELHVDLLTPMRGKASNGPVNLPTLNVAATPIRFLDYLLEETQPAVAIHGAGVLVNVPDPARFALHKLVVAVRRPAAQATKSRKDLAQATSLIDVLLEDRPDDLSQAWEGADSMPEKFRQQIVKGAGRLPSSTKKQLSAEIPLEQSL